jgi:hypothetical protein
MHFGQKVQFHSDHVLDIDRKENQPVGAGLGASE